MPRTLPRSYEEIHTRSLDVRGRPFKGSLPRTMEEIHAIALRDRTR